jgi:hypothetical protein
MTIEAFFIKIPRLHDDRAVCSRSHVHVGRIHRAVSRILPTFFAVRH